MFITHASSENKPTVIISGKRNRLNYQSYPIYLRYIMYT